MNTALHAALERLELALAHEHDALMAGDATALHAATGEKLAAMQAVEDARLAIPDRPLHPQLLAHVETVASRNRTNGALIAAGQRSAQRALERLGRLQLEPDYDEVGRPRMTVRGRGLGAA